MIMDVKMLEDEAGLDWPRNSNLPGCRAFRARGDGTCNSPWAILDVYEV